MVQKKVIILTQPAGDKVLIGVESIIIAEVHSKHPNAEVRTKITSREAMATTTWVRETVEEIYNLINS